MRQPKAPPNASELIRRTLLDRRSSALIVQHASDLRSEDYLHWDDLRHREPPADLSHEQWWVGLKIARAFQAKELPLADAHGVSFTYNLVGKLLEGCQLADREASGRIKGRSTILNADTRDRYVFASLADEAIHSSMLEGAVTTRRVAKEMIRTKRAPTSPSERMIMNNFRAMELVRSSVDEPLSERFVLEVHRTLTIDTLDDPADAGRLRRTDDVIVQDLETGETLHSPPPAKELPGRLRALCDFANGETPSGFLHPLLRGMLVHFWLAYDHPFVDGNGRTARALFFWVLLRNGYWLFEFLSVSKWILNSKRQYYRSFLLTETDERDTTYFLLYHLKAVQQALAALHEYLERKAEEVASLERLSRSSGVLNHRQQALVAHALRHPSGEYTFESHQNSHGVVYQTARTDLLDLEKRGLLAKKKRSKTFVFRATDDLEARLKAL